MQKTDLDLLLITNTSPKPYSVAISGSFSLKRINKRSSRNIRNRMLHCFPERIVWEGQCIAGESHIFSCFLMKNYRMARNSTVKAIGSYGEDLHTDSPPVTTIAQAVDVHNPEASAQWPRHGRNHKKP